MSTVLADFVVAERTLFTAKEAKPEPLLAHSTLSSAQQLFLMGTSNFYPLAKSPIANDIVKFQFDVFEMHSLQLIKVYRSSLSYLYVVLHRPIHK